MYNSLQIKWFLYQACSIVPQHGGVRQNAVDQIWLVKYFSVVNIRKRCIFIKKWRGHPPPPLPCALSPPHPTSSSLWAVYTCTKDIYIFLFVLMINRRMQNPRRWVLTLTRPVDNTCCRASSSFLMSSVGSYTTESISRSACLRSLGEYPPVS